MGCPLRERDERWHRLIPLSESGGYEVSEEMESATGGRKSYTVERVNNAT